MKRLKTAAPIWMLLTAAALGGLFVASPLRLNLTPSLPLGLYRYDEGPLERGVLVAACLPLEWAQKGRRRGYLSRGRCPGGVSPVLKRVGALGGDIVTVSDEGVFVDGALLQAAGPRIDSQGRPLEPLASGQYRMAPQDLWLSTPEPRSWDSRYYGPVLASAVLGRVRPVWTLSPEDSSGTDALGWEARR